jgi:DNA-binding beta-propeller fold protein YncE
MNSDNGNRSRAAWARGFMALFAMLAMLPMGLGLLARPAAAPFANVTNSGDGTVSVINTGANPPAVVGMPITMGISPQAVAVTPDGKHAYVANAGGNTVSVIATSPTQWWPRSR